MTQGEPITVAWTQWLADHLSSIAAEGENGDFVLRVEANRIIYVDPEANSVFIVTVSEASFE